MTSADRNNNSENPPQQNETVSGPESLLANLDKMERELERIQNEPPPYTVPPLGPDKLDLHEETLRNIAFKLDSLLADLLEAEAREYECPEFPPHDETDPSLNTAAAQQSGDRIKHGRNVQEILVIAVLIAAVFLVGMTFGLWGSFFFGL